MSVLADEDPDMLHTLVSVIEFADKEAERRSRQR
jgi:hypothetical protein